MTVVAAQRTDERQVIVRRTADVDVSLQVQRRTGVQRPRVTVAVAAAANVVSIVAELVLVAMIAGQQETSLQRSVDVLVAHSLAVRTRLR